MVTITPPIKLRLHDVNIALPKNAIIEAAPILWWLMGSALANGSWTRAQFDEHFRMITGAEPEWD